MNELPEDQRRLFGRFPVRVRVQLEHGGQSEEAVTENLGLGGLFVSVPRALPYDTLVHVRFHLDEVDVDVHVDGRVVWVRNDTGREGVGILFDSLKPIEVWGMLRFQRMLEEQGVIPERDPS